MAVLSPPVGDDSGGGATPTNAPAASTSALIAASYAITGATDRRALNAALTRIFAQLGDAYCLARLRRGSRSDPEIVATWEGSGQPTSPEQPHSPAVHPAIAMVTQDGPRICDDCASHPGLDQDSRRRLEELGVRSFGLYPLIQGEALFGALVVDHRTPHRHTPEEIQFFSIAAQLASVALANIDDRAQLPQITRASALYRTSEALGAIADEDALMNEAARLLVEEIGYVSGWVTIVDEAAGLLHDRVLAGLGAYPGRVTKVFPLTDVSIAVVEAAHTGKLVIVDDIQVRAEAEGWGAVARAGNLRSVVYAPLKAGGKTLGVLGIGRTEEQVSEEEIMLTSTFANQLASTILRVRADIERSRQVAALEQAYATQARLLETVRELSTPVIPVHDGVLVVPLVGTIETTRGAQIMEALLQSIQKERASVVILDITGVPMVDTGVANYLLGSTRAAALLGAKCVLVGISPVVARTMVALGVDLGGIITRNDLQAGITYALSVLNLEIRPMDSRALPGRRAQ